MVVQSLREAQSLHKAILFVTLLLCEIQFDTPFEIGHGGLKDPGFGPRL